MNHHTFSGSSLERLNTCDPRLVKLANKTLYYSKYDIGIAEGVRTLERQKKMVDQGKSTTMHSLHLPDAKTGLSKALDFFVYVPQGGTVYDLSEKEQGVYYRRTIKYWIKSAIELNIQVEFGALWGDFIDYPHVQLAE